jgi:uncharacterized phosphosugar-binding protein
MVDVTLGGGRLLVAGSGHSHMLAEEAFSRAGGLYNAVPIFMPALMLHESVTLGSHLERTAGIAGPLLESYQPSAGEMIFIFSNSGVNRFPVELALAAKAKGLTVVAVCSRSYAEMAPLSALGKHLPDVADYCLDNYGVPGDALVAVPGTTLRVAPSSTVIGALLWNCLVAEVAYRLQQRGEDLPVFISGNMPGAAEHNAALAKRWKLAGPLGAR